MDVNVFHRKLMRFDHKKRLTWSLLYYSPQSSLKNKTSLMFVNSLALPHEFIKIASQNQPKFYIVKC